MIFTQQGNCETKKINIVAPDNLSWHNQRKCSEDTKLMLAKHPSLSAFKSQV